MRTELRVGIFVLIGLSMVGLIVFLIGDASRVFETKTKFNATFDDVQGLTRGSSVQMGGVTIGRVSGVQYGEDTMSSDITVEMEIVTTESRRIRQDSVITIEPKGLLGDKQMSVTVGSAESPQLQDGATIKSSAGNGLMNQLAGMTEKASAVVGNLEKTTGTFAEEEFRTDLAQSASALRSLLQSLNTGHGYVPKLLNDQQESEKLSKAIDNLEQATGRLNRLLAGVDKVIRRVNDGPGTAHELIYGESGTVALKEIGGAAEQLDKTLEEIRSGNGVASEILFGGGSGDAHKVVANLAELSADLKALSGQIRDGKGTLGALMVDPSVYEDLKVLLGNVQRNEVLRALVRYSIKQDEQRPKVEAPDGPAK